MFKSANHCNGTKLEASPWNEKSSLVFLVFLAMALASAVIVHLLLSWGVSGLRSRGCGSVPYAGFWSVLFGLCWLPCLVVNATRLIRLGIRGTHLYDIASGAVAPAMVSGGIGYLACLLAYPLPATIVGGLVLANSVSVFRDLEAVPLQGVTAQLMEFCAVTGGTLFLAFCLFSVDWGFGL